MSSLLDGVLALQLTIAWAGEGSCVPARLGWWRTDLVDPAGGGDLFARLTPRTAAWAGLEAVREAARRVDEQARKQTSEPDRLRTLFFFGFEIDEHLADRLAALKRSRRPPLEVLPLPVDTNAAFSSDALAAALVTPGSEYTVVPGGRRLKSTIPRAPELVARHLAAALLPLGDTYPMPFFQLGR